MFLTFLKEKIFILEYSLYKYFYSIVDVKFYFFFDYISNIFLWVVSLITMLAFLYRKFYMESDKNQIKFINLTFFFVFCIYIIVLSINIFMILLG